ncbi:MAG TPA: DNA polymerase I [Candidatus Dormibacteraeota bacterium]
MGPRNLLLIDGHALVFRAFFGMPVMTTTKGEQTHVAYGFTAMLLKALNERHPTHAVAAFDPPGPTFRHQEMEGYKAQRPPAPDEVRTQLPWCREIVGALGIPVVELPGYEADDVIGTLARRAVEQGFEVLILTGDLDALQLVDEHVTVLAASRTGITDLITYDLAAVRARYGFEPPLVADYKALQGDASDNIPGVPGIGDKTAKALIQEHGELDAILAAVPDMKEGRARRNLDEFAEQARLSKRMATIVRDLDVPFEVEGARLGGYDRETVRQLFERWEFRSLMARLPAGGDGAGAPAGSGPGVVAPGPHAPPEQPALPLVAAPSGTEVMVVRDAAQAQAAAARLRAAPRVGVRSLVAEPAREGRVVGIAFAPLDDAERAWYLPLGHDELGGSVDGGAAAPLLEVLVDAAVPKAAYDVKRELLAWWPRGIEARGFDRDLLLLSYLTTTRERVAELGLLLTDTCGVAADTERALLGSGRSLRTAAQLGVDEAAACVGRLAALFGPLLEALDGALTLASMRSLHDDMELPLAGILARMEVTGIGLDPQALHDVGRDLAQRIAAVEDEVHGIAGHPFNLGSVPQLAHVLYDELGLAAGRRIKTGRSTDADSLEALREENPIAELILEWRNLRIVEDWVGKLPTYAAGDGRVHTSFNQAVATTGRLSSADPNLQNIPLRTEWGHRIRRAFVPEARGWLLVSADYSQIELRVLAHVTNDATLTEAFRQREDIHATTAARVYGVDLDVVTPEMRRLAKVVNFGILYGLSEYGLARDTGMTREAARAYIDTYFRTFSTIGAYQDQILNFARSTGYVETLFGRRRYLPNLLAAQRNIRQGAERQAINMPIQGTAADIMKLAMIRADRQLREAGMQARILLQVHDELVLEAPDEEVAPLGALLRDAMGGAVELVVPLEVEVKAGQNWATLAPVPEAVGAGSG